MTLDTRPTLTIAEVASVAAQVADIDGAVAELAPDLLMLYLIRLTQVTEVVGKWKRTIEQRMTVDGMVGAHYTDAAHDFAFLRSSRGDFANPRDLFADLIALGVPPLSIAEAVSKVKVTTLRDYAATIKDEEKRAVVLETVEEHRTKVEGAPRLVDLDNKYLKGAIAAKRQKENE